MITCFTACKSLPGQICVDYCRSSHLTGHVTVSVKHATQWSWSCLVCRATACSTNVCARVMQQDHTHAVHLALLALVYYDCVMRTSMHEKWSIWNIWNIHCLCCSSNQGAMAQQSQKNSTWSLRWEKYLLVGMLGCTIVSHVLFLETAYYFRSHTAWPSPFSSWTWSKVWPNGMQYSVHPYVQI